MTQSLDATDLRILGLLARDGRMSHTAVGSAVGLSGPAVYERIRKLERGGAIRAYRAVLDPALVGAGLLAFVEVDLSPAAATGEVLAAVEAWPEALEAHRVFGADALLIKVAAASAAALQTWIDALRELPGVAATRTRVVGATAFERGPAVVERGGAALPRRDRG